MMFQRNACTVKKKTSKCWSKFIFLIVLTLNKDILNSIYITVFFQKTTPYSWSRWNFLVHTTRLYALKCERLRLVGNNTSAHAHVTCTGSTAQHCTERTALGAFVTETAGFGAHFLSLFFLSW